MTRWLITGTLDTNIIAQNNIFAAIKNNASVFTRLSLVVQGTSTLWKFEVELDDTVPAANTLLQSFYTNIGAFTNVVVRAVG